MLALANEVYEDGNGSRRHASHQCGFMKLATTPVVAAKISPGNR